MEDMPVIPNILPSIKRMQFLLETIPSKLILINEIEFADKPLPNKWSKKEILGHLIDSASNNHHRFIRIQYEINPTVSYDQDKWNELNNWQQYDSSVLINFWMIYNHLLINIMKMIPQKNLSLMCETGDGKKVSMEFLINDYVAHQEHHLKQIVKI